MVSEFPYHYLWAHRMMGKSLCLTDGRPVGIVSPGIHNNDAGPDFTGAKLRIDDALWAGNVEVHVKASDWYRHHHDADPAYDSVILHLVADDDTTVARTDGTLIPQAACRLSDDFLHTFSLLASDIRGRRCESVIERVPQVSREDWLESLGIERLQMKADRISGYWEAGAGDWEQAAFIALARGLGFGLNSVPFEILASGLPLKYIYHHADYREQVEALVMGRAGILDPYLHPEDEYYQLLCSEFAFLSRKYDLQPMQRQQWKYSKTRPGNFPHRRMAYLAQMLCSVRGLASHILDAKGDIDRLRDIFDVRLCEYWRNHESFGRESRGVTGALTPANIDLLLINVAAPFYYAYGDGTGDPRMRDVAQDILEHLKAERNSIIASWDRIGLKPHSAMRSQALMHLHNEYCLRSRCLDCRFGYSVLRFDAATEADRGRRLSQYADPEEYAAGHARVVVATDSFKGCLTSAEAGEAIAAGLREADPDVEIEVVSMADGGEGMADAIGDARALRRIEMTAHDPLGRGVKVSYRYDDSISCAFIDSAAACGLGLVAERERDILKGSSRGLGEMMADALRRGVRAMVIGLGGTAVNDAGLGALQALGADILLFDGSNASRQEEGARALSAADMERVAAIDLSGVSDKLRGVRILLACDVRNPLSGANGAVEVFAPQKGASEQEMERLERGMEHLRHIIADMTGKDLNMTEGAGAAGGIAGAFAALLGGEIHSGTEVVAHCIGLRRRLRGASLVITGEGSADTQTLGGKMPLEMLRICREEGVAAVLMAGKIENPQDFIDMGFAAAININSGYGPQPDPRRKDVARLRLRQAAKYFFKA